MSSREDSECAYDYSLKKCCNPLLSPFNFGCKAIHYGEDESGNRGTFSWHPVPVECPCSSVVVVAPDHLLRSFVIPKVNRSYDWQLGHVIRNGLQTQSIRILVVLRLSILNQYNNNSFARISRYDVVGRGDVVRVHVIIGGVHVERWHARQPTSLCRCTSYRS